ncbi:SHOCT domain-containing protein [Lactobacillus amylovorus]|uniref:SHOCT domain-containing protein n=1 Tax=Lactobacillus amylovorus TaxID=1604 RepID=UPI00232AAA79|nr:SHOCT domain-containing protein [Lactobacillus amylovorus]MDB6225870.1 SHOCT domain-containing protein [Lactobacillus amylovorus]
MGLFDLFSKKQRKANQAFLADQRSQQVIAKIKKLDLPAELKQQLINAKVYDIWFNSKDLAPLSNLLSDHEKIEYAVLGITDQGEDVMLTCTNQNLIILSKKHPSENSRVIPLTEIMSVLLQQQIISEELTLIVNNEQVNINLLNKTTAALLTATIKKWSRNDDNLDEQVEQIKKLKDLLDQGILTEEEFQAKKKQILKI